MHFIKIKIQKAIASLFVLWFLLISILAPLSVHAQGAPDATVAINVQTGTQVVREETKNAAERGKEILGTLAAVLFKNLLTIFFTELASQTAEWIASGGEGEGPLIFGDDWGTYLQGVGEAAVASTVLDFGQRVGLGDLCVSPEVAIDIFLPAIEQSSLARPKCSLQELAKTWDVTSPEFLENFTLSFETGQNDLGIAASFLTAVQDEKQKEEKARENERLEGDGFKATKEKITKAITAPGTLVKEKLTETQGQFKDLEIYTGEILADTINAFTSTLFGQLLTQLKSGFFSASDIFSVTSGAEALRRQALLSLTNPEATGPGGGALAEAVFRDIFTPNLKQITTFDVLSEIGACPSEVKYASLFNCSADTSFIQALQGNQKDGGFYTLEEAVQSGALHGDWTFGYIDPAGGIEPSHLNGYAYSNMKKLRRLRIIPVGWEMAALRARDLGQRVTLNDVILGFDDQGSPFYKLVDPDWVLKVPEVRCTARAAGQLALTGGTARYTECVDVQDCVSFGSNGECLSYGYCTHVKRAWDFPGQSCPEQFATCDRFVEEGQGVSDNLWLSTTLKYEGCNADTAGCTWYALEKNAAGEWLDGDKVYLTDKAEQCDESDVGCHTFIRMGQGSNLIRNSSFEDDGGHNYVLGIGDQVADNELPDGWQASEVLPSYSDSPVDGQKAIRLETTGGGSCTPGLVYQAPIGAFEVGQSYILSGYIQSESLDPVDVLVSFQGIPFTVSGVTAGWQPFSFQLIMPATNNRYELRLGANNGECSTAGAGGVILYDTIQLERGLQATDYKQYGDVNVIHMQDAPACTFEEVGCQRYVPDDPELGFEVTGIVTGQDLCPRECVGYQTYFQKEIDFEPSKFTDFISTTAKQCTAEAVGCEQFTNLDEVSLGGEGVEYYTDIKHCEKPQPACGTFFAWEGSDTTGFQLSNFSLLTDSQSGIGNPVMTDQSSTCDPADVDCRELIAEDGTRYFRSLNQTISCSNQCAPLRARAGLVNQSECEERFGTFDTATNRCVFQAIATESQVCQAQQLGCREYVGNTGENVQVIYSDDFEGSFLAGWDNGTLSTESTEVGGHSLKLSGNVGSINEETSLAISPLQTGANYILDLTAKSNVSDFLTVSLFLGETPEDATRIGGFVIHTEPWNQYSLGPIEIPQDANLSNYRLFLSVEGSSARDEVIELFVDNLLLRKVSNSVYAIKDSWDTPLTCDTNPPVDGGTASRSMVGCQAYTIENDDGNEQVFAKSFSRLCSEEKIGCEAVLDTYNSAVPYREIFNEGDGAETIVPEDSVTYMVVSEQYECDESDVGCEELGKPIFDQERTVTGFESAFLINDPNRYNEILCQDGSLMCKAYSVSDGSTVFAKDPLLQQCQYRQVPNSFPPRYAWFKLGDDEENPDDCIEARTSDFAQRCPQQHVSCTEFYEPISEEAYYYKKTALLDRSNECNGVANWKKGCVLFNDLSETDLLFKSGDDIDFIGAPQGCQRGDEGCNANTLLKVSKNNVCSQWITGASLSRFWDKNLDQYRVSSYGLGRCIESDPVNPTICRQWDNSNEKDLLTLGKYQARETNWASDEATGYSIPGLYPVETLRQRSVALDQDNQPTNFILTKLSDPGGTCSTTTDCPIGQVCRAELDDTSGVFSGRCYVEAGLDGGGLISAPSCRAYPETSSPFPSDLGVFATTEDLENPGMILTKDQRFKDAAIAQEGEDAECSYQKVKYETETQYYGLETIPPSIIRRDSEDVFFEKVDTYLGWKGYCIEKDPSRLINGSDSEAACLTWYPVDLIQGAFDVNNSSLKAGYVVPAGAEYYCAEAVLAEYRTTWYRCRRGSCGPGYTTTRRGSCAGHEHNKRECNPIGGDGWYPHDGNLIGHERGQGNFGVMCSKVARISDAQGLTSAWTTRIRGGDLPGSEEYFVQDLGFGFDQFNGPYGSARAGVLRLEELTQPLLVLNPNEFVSECEKCERTQYYKGASIREDSFSPFGICEDEDPKLDGEPCYLRPNAGTPFAIDASMNRGALNDKVVRIRLDNVSPNEGSHPYPRSETFEEGFDRLEQLFATSYGVWGWKSIPSVCVGTCNGGVGDGEFCSDADACGVPEEGYTYACLPDLCVGGYKNGESCLADTDCEYVATDTINKCVPFTEEDGTRTTVCESGPWVGVTCDTDASCSEDSASGVCSSGTVCQATDAGGNIVSGDNSGRSCGTSSECNEIGVCQVQRCSSDPEGTNSGLCSAKSAGDQCGSGKITNQYARLSLTEPGAGWDLIKSNPSIPQPPVVRPVVPDTSRLAGFTEGFTTGFTVNGVTTGDINAQDGRAPVSLSFYAYNENGEQMPLRLMLVDWGDGTDPVEARGAFKNHKHICKSFCSQEGQSARSCSSDIECQDEDNPEAQCLPFNFGDSSDACIQDEPENSGFFSFTHTYTCDSATPCTYKPKVLVKDNWGATTNAAFPGNIVIEPRAEEIPEERP
jgi:hypothetical protein